MLDLILLIDDNDADNFFHEIIIKQANFANKIITMKSAIDALEYLTTPIDEVYPNPDFIFLDINMPEMNGWEFMEAYSKIITKDREAHLIVMLSTSLNPDDDMKARQNPLIRAFMNKPLTVEILENLVHTFTE